MRQIAALVPTPLRVPVAAMASPDQDSMRDGYDLTRRRLRSRAVHGAANATGAAPGGGAWEAVAAEGGDCRRAADREGGDDRASGSGIARRPDEGSVSV
jgi:hypothetical protein